MLWQSLSEPWPVALMALLIAIPLGGAFVRRRGFWLDSKLTSVFEDMSLNVLLASIIVVLGLLTVIITPILPLLALGLITVLLPINKREMIKFVMLGMLSVVLGALTVVDLPLSPINFMRVEGVLYPGTLLETLGSYTIFGIAAIGLFSLFILKPHAEIETDACNSEA